MERKRKAPEVLIVEVCITDFDGQCFALKTRYNKSYMENPPPFVPKKTKRGWLENMVGRVSQHLLVSMERLGRLERNH